ncbi:hypothetical protein [Pseudonocardia broussonetiae]|uniref:Uncharacterized protein n=1 Tax=Pseudonocardia broussonetiae TaxID=2736640 RepID=A0A6M6JUP8_9PSEU|nr:hypothetical protein [Pseudonocardia broussonetiae]QJY51210.1 hypothetical protein HOP40_35085 [Pseudonocardia broussonetiae]QJY51223.1 hypothetical protein HOP40_35155 [Pseudonocardia broussonetiae]
MRGLLGRLLMFLLLLLFAAWVLRTVHDWVVPALPSLGVFVGLVLVLVLLVHLRRRRRA